MVPVVANSCYVGPTRKGNAIMAGQSGRASIQKLYTAGCGTGRGMRRHSGPLRLRWCSQARRNLALRADRLTDKDSVPVELP